MILTDDSDRRLSWKFRRKSRGIFVLRDPTTTASFPRELATASCSRSLSSVSGSHDVSHTRARTVVPADQRTCLTTWNE